MPDILFDIIIDPVRQVVPKLIHDGTRDEGLIAYSLLTTVVAMLYVDHLVHTYRLWRKEGSYRSIRNFFIAVMLMVGMLALILGALSQFIPIVNHALVFLGSIIRGMLLVGGLLIFVSWRREGPH